MDYSGGVLSVLDVTQDTDMDGLPDALENASCISPTDADSDDDGIDDAAEVAAGLDPLDASDARKDADGDGVANLAEYQAGTDINSANDQPPESDEPSVLATPVLHRLHPSTQTSSFNAPDQTRMNWLVNLTVWKT